MGIFGGFLVEVSGWSRVDDYQYWIFLVLVVEVVGVVD